MPELTVDDEENRSQARTINRIQQFRDDIAEYQLFFAQNELTGEISERRAHRSYHQLVKGFVQLLRPYFNSNEIPSADRYWNEIDLGSFTISPPRVIQPPDQADLQHGIATGNQQLIQRADPRNTAEPKAYAVQGVRDFYAVEQPEWDVSWQVMFGPEVTAADLRREIDDDRVSVRPRSHRNDPLTVVKHARVPRRIIDDVVVAVESFVGDLGMDIELDEEEQQTKIDRELLEEVDEWRRQNVN